MARGIPGLRWRLAAATYRRGHADRVVLEPIGCAGMPRLEAAAQGQARAVPADLARKLARGQDEMVAACPAELLRTVDEVG